jgi:RecA/RadA recombinase
MTRSKRRGTASKPLIDSLKTGAVRISDQYGEQIRATSVAKEFSKSLIHTGDLELDLNMRPTVGSRITLIGEQHMGKTVSAYRLMGALQRTCRQCFTPIIPFLNDETGEVVTTCECGQNDGCTAVYFDLENEFDPGWAKTLGVQGLDTDVNDFEEAIDGLNVSPDAKFAVCRVTSAEQAAILIEHLMSDNSADCVVLDSIASLNPDENRQGKQQPAAVARALSRFIPKLLAAQSEAWIRDGVAPTFIATNQYRTNINVMNPKADPRVSAGGKAYQYGNMQEWQIYSRYNEGITDRTMPNMFSDMRYTAKKDKQTGNTNAQGVVRLFLKPFTRNRLSYEAGETNNPEILFDILKTFASDLEDDRWYMKKGANHFVLGQKFQTAQAIKEFLRRPDIAFQLQLPIMARLLPASVRIHLDVGKFSYNPHPLPVLKELIDETQESVGSSAARDVGKRSWMDERYQTASETPDQAEGPVDPFEEQPEPETGSEA